MAKIETPRPIRGTQDMLGGTPDSLADRFAHVVETFERVRKLYGFRRIEVPVFEQTAVFAAAWAKAPTWWRRRCTRSRIAAAIR
jgi:histidyl-tRNA synthetase